MERLTYTLKLFKTEEVVSGARAATEGEISRYKSKFFLIFRFK
jgi:hypothetical protein